MRSFSESFGLCRPARVEIVERITAITARQAVPRTGTPDEAAEAYFYLMRARYTSGQVIRVDGGMRLT